MPSGTSLMAWNLVRLGQLTGEEGITRLAERQLDFLAAEAERYPTGFAMFLLALLDNTDPPPKATVVLADRRKRQELPLALPAEAVVTLREPGQEYPLKEGRTTFYVCRGRQCLPPSNRWPE